MVINNLLSLAITSSFCFLKEAEQAVANKLKLDHAAMIESYEARLNQLPSSTTSTFASVKTTETERVKEEPIDCNSRQMSSANHQLEIQIVKDRLEQAQIDLGLLQRDQLVHLKLKY